MPRSVLVLTATGTTGRATVTALVARGATVRAASRVPATAGLPAGVEVVPFSYDDRDTWPVAFAGVEAVYLAMPPFRADEADLGRALVAAAKAAGVRRIVKLSAAGVDAAPESGHRQVEVAVEASGLNWLHLRPSFFDENFIEFYGGSIKGDGGIYLPAGTGTTAFIAAADVGAAAAEALLGDMTGEAWTLTGPEALDHAQVAAALTEVLGRPIRYVDITPEDHVAGMRGFGMPEVGVQTMSGLYGMVRQGWTGGLSPDLARVTGSAGIRFADWARAHAAAWG